MGAEEVYVRLKVLSPTTNVALGIQKLGIPVSRSWIKGDQRLKTQIVEPHFGCIIVSGMPTASDMNSQLVSLFTQIEPFRDEIISLCADVEIEVSCVLYCVTEPALNFDPRLIGRVAAFNASLDVDLYIRGKITPVAATVSQVDG